MKYDVVIIGAGISGMSCAIYLKRAGLSVLLVENNVPGGQLSKIDTIENYPGYVSVSGFELANKLMEQIGDNNIEISYDEVKSIDYDNKLILFEGQKYSYQYLVFATGRREKMLGLNDEANLIGKGISFCATCDGALYRDKDVIVVGGANSAVSEAIYLSNICRKVYLVYRKSELRAEDILKQRLNKLSNVEVIYESNVSNYIVEDDIVKGVILDDESELRASCVFLAIGYLPNSDLFDGESDNGYIIVDNKGQTSRSDVYACGDVILKNVYQLITASSEGVVVATSIIEKNQRD